MRTSKAKWVRLATLKVRRDLYMDETTDNRYGASMWPPCGLYRRLEALAGRGGLINSVTNATRSDLHCTAMCET